MAANGNLIFQDTNKATFVGANSNVVIDTVHASLGIGVDVNGPTSNLHVVGNAYVTSNLTVTGNTLYTNPTAVLVDSNVVTEYTGPHDRPLRKYPEVALTANSDSGYVASASSSLTSSPVYLAFDGSTGTTWHTQFPYYTVNGGVYDPGNGPGAAGTYSGTLPSHELVSGYAGEYITLGLPNKIKMSKISINTRVDASLNLDQTQSAEVIVVVGSHDGSTWEFVDTHTVGKYPDDNTIPYTFNVNTSTYYEHVGLICTNTGPTDSVYNSAWSISKLAFYGYEEGSGSLDTTLKSVYNVPATTGTQLEVYYDGQDYTADTDFDQANEVLDNSGNNLHGSQAGGVGFDSTYKAFTFGAGDYIQTQTLPSTFIDDTQHSIAMWFNLANLADTRHLFWIDDNTTGVANQSPHAVISSAGILRYDFFANDIQLLDQIVPNQWYHLVITFSGGNHQSGTKFYINGVHNTNVSTPSSTATLDIQASSYIVIGANNVGTTSTTFNGSIANFRLYSKALNADQVKELYDYQKDYFLGSKSQVTLYKGHLGVGVTEPSGQLELAGDERIQEYPPRGLVGDETLYDPAGNAYDYNVEGHGVFKLLSSEAYHNGTGSNDRRIYKLFDKSNNTLTHWDSFNSIAPYDAAGGSGAWVTTLDGGSTITAHIAEIQMPYKITLKKYILTSSSQVPRALKTGMIVGSNDGNVFHVLDSVSDFGFTATSQPKEYTVDNTTTPYRIFRLLLMNTNGHPTCNMNEWRLFGTPGPTTLDKGSLTLGRSLDVPRVSRYDVDTETPRPEKLLIDYDTTVNSSLTDISGKGNHGIFFDDAHWSAADKAFEFDGTDDYSQTPITIAGGNMAWTQSMWFKINAFLGSGYSVLSFFGNKSALSGHIMSYKNNEFWQDWYGNGVYFNYTFEVGQWYHVASVYHGNTSTDANLRSSIYINGVKQTLTWYSQTSSPMTLPTSTFYELADHINASNTRHNGLISNVKLYDVALEPSEVQKLYRLGRTGRSMVISDTAVGIGKVPEAQLDVRGAIKGINMTSSPAAFSVAYNPTSLSGNQTIIWNLVYHNVGDGYNSSDGFFTAPVSGYYHFTVWGMTSGSASGTVEFQFMKNGSVVQQRPYGQAGGNYGNATGSIIEYLNIGNTMSIFLTNGTTLYATSAQSYNGFSGFYLSS